MIVSNGCPNVALVCKPAPSEAEGAGLLTSIAATPAALLAELPGPGIVDKKQIALLADAAPTNRDSDPWRGQAHIVGARHEMS